MLRLGPYVEKPGTLKMKGGYLGVHLDTGSEDIPGTSELAQVVQYSYVLATPSYLRRP